jgi:hypothetical protein
MEEHEHEPKRRRLASPPPPPAAASAPAEPLRSPICGELLSHASRAALRGSYLASGPYRHSVLQPLCREERLRGVFEEMRTHLTGTFKETDLFKVRARKPAS